MKNIYYVEFYIIVLIVLLLFFYSNNKNNRSFINEEALPIRNNEIIEGMNYIVTIDNTKDNNITILSEILSSIYHYKDINNINDFYIDLKIDNKTDYNYLLKDISIIDSIDNVVIRNIDYNYKDSDISFTLNKDDFTNYNLNKRIKIELEKKYL